MHNPEVLVVEDLTWHLHTVILLSIPIHKVVNLDQLSG
jgi:hypothetical protein